MGNFFYKSFYFYAEQLGEEGPEMVLQDGVRIMPAGHLVVELGHLLDPGRILQRPPGLLHAFIGGAIPRAGVAHPGKR